MLTEAEVIWRLVAISVKNKYPDSDIAGFRKIVFRKWPAVKLASKYSEIFELTSPVDSPLVDVTNQFITLYAVKNIWRANELNISIIRKIHGLLFGVNVKNISYRKSNYVNDFGGDVPTNYNQATSSLDEIEHVLVQLTPSISRAPDDCKSNYLAYIFSSIIRVHPFEDGNGRTARMVVQYILNQWNHEAIEIPKVRNDPGWKFALSEAVNGKTSPLASEFLKRLQS